MGTIVLAESGSGKKKYKGIVRLKGYPKVSKTFLSKTDAKQWIRVTELAMDGGTWNAPAPWKKKTVSEGIDIYIEEVISHKKETLRRKNINRLNIIKRKLGNYSFHNLTEDVVRSFFDFRYKTVKWQTVLNELNELSACLEWLSARKGLGMCLAKGTNPVRVVAAKPKVLPPEKQLRLAKKIEQKVLNKIWEALKTHSNPMLYRVARLAYETGLRSEEVRQLQLDRINLDERLAFVPQTKNGEERYVALTQTALEILRQSMFFPIPPRPEDTDLIFPAQRKDARAAGKGYRFDALWRETLAAHGISGYRVHDLRHTFLSELKKFGVDIEVRMTQAGHKTQAMAKLYANQAHRDALRVVKTLEQLEKTEPDFQ